MYTIHLSVHFKIFSMILFSAHSNPTVIHNPHFMTDISYLYCMELGAARVALGADLPAVFSNDIIALMVSHFFTYFFTVVT
jgi:hypothetical protein